MKIPRRLSIAVQFILDELVPPIIRDSKWFMYIPMKLVLKDKSSIFMNFKDYVWGYNPKEFGNLYEATSHVQELQGETDLNKACTREILKSISGNNIVEIGCGRGYLSGLIADRGHNITACDIVVPKSLVKKYPKVNFIEGNIEHLPFKDNTFDTVITTHTLEHVQNLPQAVSELRRIAKKELIIVVPRQRPYKFTFSLHTQFFPYRWSLENAFGYRKKVVIKKLGDWFYKEYTNETRG